MNSRHVEGVQAADADTAEDTSTLRSLWPPSTGQLEELRMRGLHFPEEHSEHPLLPGVHPSEETGSNSPDVRLDGAALLAQVRHLERGLATRTVIGQAKGILMERYDITADAAFAMLRGVSNVTNRKLCDIATELADTRILPGLVPPEGSGVVSQ